MATEAVAALVVARSSCSRVSVCQVAVVRAVGATVAVAMVVVVRSSCSRVRSGAAGVGVPESKALAVARSSSRRRRQL